MLAGGVPHIVGNLLTKAMTLSYTSPKSKVYTSNGPPKWWESQFGNFETPNLRITKKMTFGCNPYG